MLRPPGATIRTDERVHAKLHTPKVGVTKVTEAPTLGDTVEGTTGTLVPWSCIHRRSVALSCVLTDSLVTGEQRMVGWVRYSTT